MHVCAHVSVFRCVSVFLLVSVSSDTVHMTVFLPTCNRLCLSGLTVCERVYEWRVYVQVNLYESECI